MGTASWWRNGVSEAGSDWTTFRLLNLGSADQVEDALIQAKFSQAEWRLSRRSVNGPCCCPTIAATCTPILIMRATWMVPKRPRSQDPSCGSIASATHKIMTN